MKTLEHRLANILAFERRRIRSSVVALVRRTLPVRLHSRALLARRIDALGASSYLRDGTLAVALIGMTVLGIGCAKAQVVRKSPPPPVAVSVASAPPTSIPAPAAKPALLPDAPLEGLERPRASAVEFHKPARRYTLVMAGADARELFLSLARENDFNLVLSPEVSGTVTMDIKEATAEELMDEVCGMLGCRAVFGGNTVRVAPEKRVTRVFPVDYLLTARSGSGSLMASTSTSGGGGGSVSGSSAGSSTSGSESQSTNTIVTEEKGDFWGGLADEIGQGLGP